MRALQIAATGMSAQQMRVEVVSNNLANMSTTGYNARRAEFADLHYQQVARPGTINASDGTVLPTGIQLGLGAPFHEAIHFSSFPHKSTALFYSKSSHAPPSLHSSIVQCISFRFRS